MGVLFYEWGKLTGGTSSSGSISVPDSASYGEPEVFEGTLGAGDTTITFSNQTKHVTIRNTHDSDSLEYSFDGGITWFLALAYQVVQEPVSVNSLLMRNVGVGSATYEITAVLMA